MKITIDVTLTEEGKQHQPVDVADALFDWFVDDDFPFPDHLIQSIDGAEAWRS